MAAIVFPPHSAPRPVARTPRRTRPVAGFPGGAVRQVPVSHPRPIASGSVVPLRPAVAPVRGPGGVPAAVYRRRRVAVALAAIAAVVIGVLLTVSVASQVGAATASPPAPASASLPVAAGASGTALYTVRPGDTLWSIARRLQPEGDVRPLVDELAERNGGTALRVGQRLDLGALGGVEVGGPGGIGR